MTESSQPLGIAIVGMSCAFPGADSPEQFWRNIRDGVESLTVLSDEDLAAAGVDPALSKAPNYVKLAASIEGIDLFDAGFFGMSPREAELMDPQQRLFLEHCWRAVEAGGYDPTRVDVPVGVYAGAGVNTYVTQIRSNADVQALNASGESLHDVGSVENDLDYLTTRVSYKLNLTGPSINVTTACSTSLVAIHMAAQALRTFECDMALAGGVAVSPPVKSGYVYREGAINSFDGHTRSFDAASTGTVLGSGIGVVLLKRLEDALADGDVIHAVIIGTAVNNDGADKAGFTAPGVPGQAEVTASAHAVAGITADSVTYQEAHGTGTRLGDPIEVQALTQAYRETTDATNYCALGSVKANIGHMDTAAGVAGLIKAALAAKNGVIPPQIHFEQPNPGLELETSPFYIPTVASAWQPAEFPRRAGVSAFGFGGTNAHVLVEQPPARQERPESADWQILPVSARDEQAVGEYLGSLADWLDESDRDRAPLSDVSATLQVGRTRFARRAAVVARTAQEAATAMRARSGAPVAQAIANPEVSFLFPGQGSQHAQMGRDLYREQPVFRAEFDRCADLFAAELGTDLRTVLFESESESQEQGAEHPVNQTRLTQPALFAVEYALAHTFAAFGVRPSAMIGHSLGEIVAATLAGVFTLEDAVRVVVKRAALMEAAPPGAMLAIALPAAEVEPLLPAGVSIAAYNGPRLVVATGAEAAIDQLAEELTARGANPRKLRVSCASHSELMEEPARQFVEFLRGIPMARPTQRVVSNVTGDWLTDADACDPEYWGRHLRGAVHFTQGLERLTSAVDGPLVEVGPGGGLLSLARANQAASAGRSLIPAMRHPKDSDDDTRVLFAALAALWETGVEPDWAGGEERTLRRVTLPTYPFQRRSYWIAGSSEEEQRLSRRLLDRADDPGHWFYAPSWRRTAGAGQLRPVGPEGWTAPDSVLVVTDKAGLASGRPEALAEQLRGTGRRCVLLADGDRYIRHSDELVELTLTDSAHLRLALTEEDAGDGRTALVFLPGAQDAVADPAGPSLALLALGRTLADTAWSGELLVVTDGSFDVLGHEDSNPAGWLLDGIARVLPREVPGLACRVVDLDPAATPQGVAADLADELTAHQPDAVIAYRRGRRWLRGIEPLTAGTRSARGPREGGVYLITGGLGGIGLSLAEFLAERYRAKLVLTGVTPFPEPEQWDGWLADHDERDRVSRRIERLRRIERHGGEVLAVSSDVSDAVAVRQLIARTEERFGRLDGVVHAAGLPGGALVQALDPDAFLRVLAPKVLGGQHLLAATEGRDLDFLMLFSSLNVIDGRFGIADYTAANNYLDGLAHQAWHRGRTEVVAVDWTGWRDLGMALDAGSTAEGNEELREVERLTIMSEAGLASFMSEPEGHEAFVRSLGLGLPQVHISTQDLNAVVEHGRRLDVATALEALAQADRRRGAYERPEIGSAYEAPADGAESFLCEVLQLLLGIEQVGATDNFFELGGNSLLALDVIARVKRRFEVEVAIGRWLALPTPRGMAGLVAEQLAPAEAP
ncbi:type I polyketide synthase [Kitasatospora mediocidica]|uniref:type I polyketide synthase n=1 Tax=Kitasatospora mediocidica TaxID=58352 RepID=UPI00068C36F5|nr:type I polyketide synthase [Kitasatospora mediocidica]